VGSEQWNAGLSGTLHHLVGLLLGSKTAPATIQAVSVLWLLAICLDLAVQDTLLAHRARNVSQGAALLELQVADWKCRATKREGTNRVPDTWVRGSWS